jgi:hypothetical protein
MPLTPTTRRTTVPEDTSQKIEITVVVSGVPERLTLHAHEKLEHVVREALKHSGNEGQPPSEWELRTEGGLLLEQSLTVAEAGVENGQTLFLSPKAGAGGDARR